jgi:hypothetical protein
MQAFFAAIPGYGFIKKLIKFALEISICKKEQSTAREYNDLKNVNKTSTFRAFVAKEPLTWKEPFAVSLEPDT